MESINHQILYITGILFLLYSVACVIARLTPTPKDDKIVSWIGRIINLLFKKANIKDDDIQDLKNKAAAIALDDIKHKLRDIGRQELFDQSIGVAAHKALSIKDSETMRNMKLRLDADVEAGLAGQAEGRIMHTRLGRRLKKKLLARKLS